MTEELTSHMERIRSLSPKLNKATDQAAGIVDRIEKFLSDECSIGISAAIPFLDVSTGRKSLCEVSSLVYERIAGKFRVGIVVQTYRENVTDLQTNSLTTESVKREVAAWSSADRETKLASFEKLPEMLKEIAEKAEKATASVGAAAKSAEAVLKALEASALQPKSDEVAEERFREYQEKKHKRTTW